MGFLYQPYRQPQPRMRGRKDQSSGSLPGSSRFRGREAIAGVALGHCFGKYRQPRSGHLG